MIDTIIPGKSVCSTYRNELYRFLSGKGIPVAYGKKAVIECGGKPADHVYMVKEGFVRQSFLNPDGSSKILLLLTKGDMFGEITLFQGDTDLVVTQAHSDVETERLSADLFMELAEREPKIFFYISLMLSNKARILMAQVRDSSFCDTLYRLKNLLVRLSFQHGRNDGGDTVIIPCFTHDELARMISSTRSTVTKKMKILEDEGFIEIADRHIIVKEKLIHAD
jgi:CRP/FNR family cyclic AMP-dependent transcriptional regulator